MTDQTIPDLITDGGILESTEIDPSIAPLEELKQAVDQLQKVLEILLPLAKTGNFKLISKKNRNSLLAQLLELPSDIKARSRMTYRILKKIKRERPSEGMLDEFLIANLLEVARETQFYGEVQSTTFGDVRQEVTETLSKGSSEDIDEADLE
jgi:hypothetical protein